jgi:carbohydrate kinase (thermoresistant glucokinase family)
MVAPVTSTDLTAPLIVVMGVSGSGKSTVGAVLAEELSVPFIDGDDLHPVANVNKMAAGQPLTDDDRWPWLESVGQALAAASTTGLVVACSALRRVYRDAIANEAPGVRFVLLDGSREILAARLGSRSEHFMPASLLDSQLATLERLADDESGVTVGIELSVEEITKVVAGSLAR